MGEGEGRRQTVRTPWELELTGEGGVGCEFREARGRLAQRPGVRFQVRVPLVLV